MMELKTVLAIRVQRFRLDLTPQRRVEATVRNTLQPRYGLLMKPQVQDDHTERLPARVPGNVVGTIPQSRSYPHAFSYLPPGRIADTSMSSKMWGHLAHLNARHSKYIQIRIAECSRPWERRNLCVHLSFLFLQKSN